MYRKANYSGGLLPSDFVTFIRISAIAGFIASLVLVSALVYKMVEKHIGKERAKKFKLIIVAIDIVVLFVFIFIYLIVI